MVKLHEKPTSVNRPLKILHSGDIHWYPFKHHEFLQQATDSLCELIEREQIDLIYLGGDITDSKNVMSPEQLIAIQIFFFKLAQLAPVIVTIGNHDFNYQNKERLDTLSPIIDNINQNINTTYPIHYLPNSGIYELYGIQWAIWSQLDDLNPFDLADTWDSQTYTIGCYHGPINGCMADNGLIRLQSNITVDTFEHCDVAMLADIHKRQQFRNGEIQYCGSWVELSFNEATTFVDWKQQKGEQKGVLIWEWIESRQTYEATFTPIETQYGHKIFKVTDLNCPIPATLQLAPKTKVRLDYIGDSINWSPTKFHSIRKKLQSLVEPQIGWKYLPVNSAKQFRRETPQLGQIDFFEKYFKETQKVSQQELDLLHQIDTIFNQRIDKTDYTTGEYVLESLTLHNFVSFGANNHIDFTQKKGLVGLFAPNKWGKSSILDAICFCLFNEPTKNINSVSELINDQVNQSAFVELIVVINGNRYRIKRTIVPPTRKTTRLKLEVYQISANGSEKAVHDRDRKVTDKWIRSMIGDKSMFLITSLSSQKNKVEFVDNKNRERLDLLIKILGITLYDKKREAASEELKSKNAELKLLNARSQEANAIEDLEQQLDILLKASRGALLERQQVAQELAQRKHVFEEVEDELIAINVKDSESSLAVLQQQQETLSMTLQTVELEYEKQSALVLHLEGKVAELTEEFNPMLESNEVKLKERVNEIQHELDSAVCTKCGAVRKIDKDDLLRQLTQSEQALRKCTAKLRAQRERQKKLERNQLDLQQGKIKLVQLEANLTRNKEQMIALDVEVENWRVNEAKLQRKVLLREQHKQLKTEIEDLQQKKTHCDILINRNQQQASSLRSTLTERLKLEDSINSLQSQVNTLELYINAMHRTGIPSLILQTFIPTINFEVNNYLSDLFEFNVNFELVDDQLNIYYFYDQLKENKRNINMTSGAEGFVINLAIRTALNKVSMLPRASILMIDEGFDVLDEDNMLNMKQLLSKLQQDFETILLITHLDELKDFPTSNINLTQQAGVTQIVT